MSLEEKNGQGIFLLLSRFPRLCTERTIVETGKCENLREPGLGNRGEVTGTSITDHACDLCGIASGEEDEEEEPCP